MRLVKIKLKNLKAFSLVEIMVAVFITSLVSLAVVSLYSTGLSTFFQIKDSAEQSDESIVLFTMIEKDLARGGFTHPIRSNVNFCDTAIAPEQAAEIHVDELGVFREISACFDRPSSVGGSEDIERYKISYRQNMLRTHDLEKKIEAVAVNDCDTVITFAELSDNAKATIHDWLPISTNLASFVVERKEGFDDVLDIEITLESQGNQDVRLNFIKRIFVKNQSLDVNSEACRATGCPNSTKPFLNYQISEEHGNWNPETNIIPGGYIRLEGGYDETEDELIIPTTEGLVVTADPERVGSYIIPSGTGSQYQALLNHIKFLHVHDGGSHANREISLFLKSDICTDLTNIQYQQGSKVYCNIENVLEPPAIQWTDAKTAAESKKYYKLEGKLVTMNDDDDISFVTTNLLKLDDIGWIGGKRIEAGDWKWVELGQPVEALLPDIPESRISNDEDAGNNYLYFNYDNTDLPIESIRFTADTVSSSIDEGIAHYIVEFSTAIGNQCDDTNGGRGCVRHYFSKTIILEDLNLCTEEPGL